MSKTSNRCGAVQRSNGNLIEKTSQKMDDQKLTPKKLDLLHIFTPP